MSLQWWIQSTRKTFRFSSAGALRACNIFYAFLRSYFCAVAPRLLTLFKRDGKYDVKKSEKIFHSHPKSYLNISRFASLLPSRETELIPFFFLMLQAGASGTIEDKKLSAAHPTQQQQHQQQNLPSTFSLSNPHGTTSMR
jgi:hypothetical protein